MRIWHLVFGILLVALVLTIARDPVGRVAVIVVPHRTATVGVGNGGNGGSTQTIGAFGEADNLRDPRRGGRCRPNRSCFVVASSIMDRRPLRRCLARQRHRHLNHQVIDYGIHRVFSRHLSSPLDSRGRGAEDLGADRALVSGVARPSGRITGRAGELALRRRRAKRGSGAGGCGALRGDDLPDRRPGTRGGLPGVCPRHRAEAQAVAERDPHAVPRLAAPGGAGAGSLSRLQSRPGEPAGPFTATNISRETAALAEL